MARILVIDSHKTTKSSLAEVFSEHELTLANDAGTAIVAANQHTPDIVILELSLASHSGLEFLYEFRTYQDWEHIPVLVYTTVRLQDTVLRSRAWQQLAVADYLYKPDTTLETLRLAVEKYVSGVSV
ncbi:response regulator [Candidatus Saccharibacteria bacterium]|nr:response regulator [Candidatus Saccharibacteria bacterium]